MDICKDNNWKYIIRYKEGCASTIEQEFIETPEKEVIDGAEYVNGIVYKYNAPTVNVLRYKETSVKSGKEKETRYTWITNIEISKTNAMKLVRAGRSRWKIENQGFNRQKHWQGNMEHACSFHEKAQKNHYLLEQISDFIKQLYEYFYLAKNEIKKTQKNISSDLLASFGRQLTREDIKESDMQSISNY